MGKAGSTLASIQILRAVAAIAVVLTHAHVTPTEIYGINRNTYSIFEIGGAGVDLFFVISGFVMVYASERLFGRPDAMSTFWLRRVVRIVPLYWIAAALAAQSLIRHAANPLTALGDYGSAIAATFFFFPFPHPASGDIAPLVPGGWTINYEMAFYLIFGALVFAPRRVCVSSVALVLCSVVAFGAVVRPTAPAFMFWTDPIILEFVLGMLVGLAFREGVRLGLVSSGALLVLGVGAFVAMAASGWGRLPRCIEFGMPSAAIAAAVTLGPLTARGGILVRTFAFVGDASYSLYLFHILALGLTRRALDPVLQSLSPTSYLVLSTVMAVLFGAAVYLLVERPVMRLLHRRLRLADRAGAFQKVPISALGHS